MRFGNCPNCREYKYLSPDEGICPACEDDTDTPGVGVGVELTPRLEMFGEEAREFFASLVSEFETLDIHQLRDLQKEALFAKHRKWNAHKDEVGISYDYVETKECEQIIEELSNNGGSP